MHRQLIAQERASAAAERTNSLRREERRSPFQRRLFQVAPRRRGPVVLEERLAKKWGKERTTRLPDFPEQRFSALLLQALNDVGANRIVVLPRSLLVFCLFPLRLLLLLFCRLFGTPAGLLVLRECKRRLKRSQTSLANVRRPCPLARGGGGGVCRPFVLRFLRSAREELLPGGAERAPVDLRSLLPRAAFLAESTAASTSPACLRSTCFCSLRGEEKWRPHAAQWKEGGAAGGGDSGEEGRGASPQPVVKWCCRSADWSKNIFPHVLHWGGASEDGVNISPQSEVHKCCTSSD